MFRRLLMIMVAVAGIALSASARDTYAHDASVLPKAAQTTLANAFKSKVSVIKIDKDFGMVSEYEVVLTDGTEITFDSDGNWKDVEVGINASVPSKFIPAGVASYIKSNQPGTHVVGIEKKRGGYDVELSNGVEMKFNSEGQFLRYDD